MPFSLKQGVLDFMWLWTVFLELFVLRFLCVDDVLR